MKNALIIGSFLCFVAAVSWGAMFPVAHASFEYIDPFYFTIIRYGAVTIILMAVLLWKEGKEAFRLEGKGVHLAFYGTMAFAVYNLLMFWGEDLLGEPGVMVASVMESLMPMISIVIVWLFFHKRPHFFTIICVIISFVGAMLVITKGNMDAFFKGTDQIIPVLFILVAVSGWVVYTLGGKEFPGWSALRYSTLSCLFGTGVAAIIVIISTLLGFVSVPSPEGLIATVPHMLFMILFPGVVALLGWNAGVRMLSPINALLFINFVPVTTLALSLFQGYEITFFDIAGTVLIIVALLLNNLYVRLQKNSAKDYVKTKAGGQRVQI